MRNLICICFFSLGVLAAYGQRVTISSPIELSNNAQYRLLGKIGEENAVFLDQGNKFELLLFDNRMKRTFGRSLREAPGRILVSGVLAKDEAVEFFFSYRHKDTTYLLHKTYDKRAVPVDSNVITRINQRFSNPFYFTQSEDKSKALFFMPMQRNKMKLVVYDVDYHRVLWEDELLFDKRVDNDFQFIEVSNQGQVFIVLDRNNSRLRIRDHFLEVYEFNQTGNMRIREIEFNDRLNYDLMGKYDNENNILFIGGFYSESSVSTASGIFLYRVAYGRDHVQGHFKPFDYKTIQDIENNRKKKLEGITDLEIADILLTLDGGAVILGEVRKEYYTRMNYSSRFSPGYNSNIDYYMEDILALAISGEGEHLWTRVIHKRQFSQDDRGVFSSFFTFKVPSFLELIFNDEISSNSTVSSFGINGIGEVNRINLMSTGLQELRIRFRRAIQTSSNSFIAPSDYKGELKLVYIEF